eukprot:GHVL01010789.1.p1 GENE.GHVL01010789.1~~GHVL01010789.1.p1  ORF type:complete len:177 (-),score=30.22 GHVL01010789.1:61-591(-)
MQKFLLLFLFLFSANATPIQTNTPNYDPDAAKDACKKFKEETKVIIGKMKSAKKTMDELAELMSSIEGFEETKDLTSSIEGFEETKDLTSNVKKLEEKIKKMRKKQEDKEKTLMEIMFNISVNKDGLINLRKQFEEIISNQPSNDPSYEKYREAIEKFNRGMVKFKIIHDKMQEIV